MRRRAAPRCPAAVCLQTARGDLPPGGRVCYGCQQKLWGRTGTIKRLEPVLARSPEVGRGPVGEQVHKGYIDWSLFGNFYDVMNMRHLICNRTLILSQDDNINHKTLLEDVVICLSNFMLDALLRKVGCVNQRK